MAKKTSREHPKDKRQGKKKYARPSIEVAGNLNSGSNAVWLLTSPSL